MLERAMRSYTIRSVDAAEMIAELVELAKQMRAEHERGAKLGLREDEFAFYDAVSQNDSAVLELGDETLKQIAPATSTPAKQESTVCSRFNRPSCSPPRSLHSAVGLALWGSGAWPVLDGFHSVTASRMWA